MRYAEEQAENYWKSHPNTNETIQYTTTPLYNAEEVIPRGSVVDIKSSDNALNKEVVVINSEEGFAIDYSNGNHVVEKKSSVADTPVKTPATTNQDTPKSASVDNGWSVAAKNPSRIFDTKSYS